MRSNFAAALLLTLSLGGGLLLVDAAQAGGCAKDTDCKGDRVCEDGKCVSPSAPTVPSGKAKAKGAASGKPSTGASTKASAPGSAPTTTTTTTTPPPPPPPPPADDVSTAPPPKREPLERERRWYGWQNIIADVAGWSMVIGATSLKSTDAQVAVGLTGLSILWVGSPIVHGQHDNNGHAATVSFVMRSLGVGLLALGASSKDENLQKTVVLGAAFFLIITIADPIIAFESPPAKKGAGASFALAPLVARQVIGLGAVGAF